MERNLSEKVTAFCRDHSLDVKLSSEMPAGYETAFGTYDVTVNTLFLNEKLLERAPQWEVLYYLYHELRHAMQYQHPEKFDPKIQESRFYVVLYNGVCFKLTDNCWQECTLEGEDFTQAYLHLPYEMDANNCGASGWRRQYSHRRSPAEKHHRQGCSGPAGGLH